MRKKASNNSNGTVQRISHQASTVVHSIADQAASTAVAGAERAKGVTSSITSVAKDRGTTKPEVPEPVVDFQHRVTEEMIPTLRDVALQAASLAVELWQSGRERAAEAVDSAHIDLAPQAAQIKEAAAKRASEVRETAAKRALDAKEASARRVSDASYAVADRAAGVADRAKSTSKHAAETTVDTTKDTGALIFWTATATAVVYFAFLDKKRRDKVLKFASDAMHQAKDLVEEMRRDGPTTFAEAA
jgi:hypothetical protein